jgi:hypothetical protein
MKRGLFIVAAALAIPLGVWADTILLKDGVQFDGVVTPMPDGKTYKIQAGDNILFYRTEEIASMEKNNRDGHVNLEEEKAKWEAEDKRLTELTGLNAQQRELAEALMGKLKATDAAELSVIREQFKNLQAQMDVFKYLEYFQPQLSHLLCVNVLETLYFLDPARSRTTLRENACAPYFWARAKALELLGWLRDSGSSDLIARGLKDFKPEVRYVAAYALANVKAREATPALIESLSDTDLRVTNATKEALAALWADVLGQDFVPETQEAWSAFWTEQAKNLKGAPVTLEALEPLIPPEKEFQNE